MLNTFGAHGTYCVLVRASNILVNNFNSVKKVSLNFFIPQLLHPHFDLLFFIKLLTAPFIFTLFSFYFFTHFFEQNINVYLLKLIKELRFLYQIKDLRFEIIK